jgi:uncharacterized protein YeaO (DUF488 family)
VTITVASHLLPACAPASSLSPFPDALGSEEIEDRDVPLTREQQLVAERYWKFSQKEARKVWRTSSPFSIERRAFLGDCDVAADVGLQALMRTAQKWPLPCHVCKGAKRMTSVTMGASSLCTECAGRGVPHNLHKAFHAYLRRAIATQVRAELNRRVREAKNKLDLKRAGSTLGRSQVGASGSAGSGSGSGSPTLVWTLRIDRTLPSPARALGAQLPDAVLIDCSPSTGGPLSPSPALSARFPVRKLSLMSDEEFEGYATEFRTELAHSRASGVWQAALRGQLGARCTTSSSSYAARRSLIVLACDCRDAARCHRSVLAELIASAVGGEVMGELGGRDSRSVGYDSQAGAYWSGRRPKVQATASCAVRQSVGTLST